MALVRLREKELKEAGVVFTQGTLYKWHCVGEHAMNLLHYSMQDFRVILDMSIGSTFI